MRNAFPVIQDCRFISIGEGKSSEVFSGIDGSALGALMGNQFSGFTHIMAGMPLE
jgi:hypothetical protein